MTPNQIGPGDEAANLADAAQVVPDHMVPDPAESGQAIPDQRESDQEISDGPTPDQATADGPTPDQTTSDDEVAFVIGDLPGGIRAALEAILMVIDTPAATTDLAIAVGRPTDQVHALLVELAASYRGVDGQPIRGFELREVGGGWRIYSAPVYARVVERFIREGATAKLTQAALETLAIVAYRQPIARGRMSAIRGVNVEAVVRTLLTRGLIEEVGQDAESGAILYGTSELFLQRMGLASLDDLEALAPHLPRGEELAEIEHQVEQ